MLEPLEGLRRAMDMILNGTQSGPAGTVFIKQATVPAGTVSHGNW